jgi:four helix bundle protein
MSKIRSHFELEVFKKAFDVSMELFELSKRFPREELYSLTDQMRRSSRSVSANISEAWRKRRYQAAFISKLSDAEGEAAETQTWIAYAVKCGYLERECAVPFHSTYEEVLRMIVSMINDPDSWTIGDR